MSLAGIGSDGVARSPPTEVVLDHRNVDTNADARQDRRGKNGTIIRHVNGGPGTTTTGPRRQILTEEEYQSALDRIISRDYYPSVPSLRRDAAVLDARARGDVAGAVAVRRAARRLERHEEVAEAEASEERKRGVLEAWEGDDDGQPVTITGAGMGLDEFHRLATSEDNAEFEEVQREEVRERREVFERVFGDRRLALTDGSIGGQEQKGKGSGQLLLKGISGDKGAGGSNATPLASDDFDLPQPRIEAAGSKEMSRNSLFFTPQLPPKAASKHSHKPSLSSKALADGGGGDDSGETRGGRERIASEAEETRLLMPPPAPVTRQSQSQSHSQPQPRPLTSVAHKQEETKERFIQPSETRFPYQGESRLPPNSSSSRRDRGGGGGGSFIPPASSDTDTDLDAPTPLSQPPSARSSGREHGRDSYVAMTPLIVPGGGGGGGDAGDPNASPIVTWGNVAGTPLVLGGEAGSVAGAALMDGVDGDQQHTPSFSLPAEDGREAAARVAEASIAGAASSGRSKRGGQKDREKRRRAPLFPSASSASVADRAASLTPAARSLLDRSAGGRRSGVGTTTPLLGSSSSSSSGKGKGTRGEVDARMGSALRSALRGSYSATPRLGVGRSSSSSSSVAAAARTPRSTPLRRRRDGGAGDAVASSSSSSLKRSRNASGGSSGRRVDGVAGHITDGLLRLDG